MDQHRADPPLGGTRAHIASILPSLVPSEQRVAQLCLDDPDRVSQMSVADLAAQTGTSPATIVRACKTMGFTGFQHLRRVMLRDLGAEARGAASAVERGSSGEPGSAEHLVSGIFSRVADELRQASSTLDFAAFDAAASALRSARRVVVLGNGASLRTSQAFALRCLAYGTVCEAPTDVVTQLLAARTLAAGDVAVAVSDSGMNAFTVAAARLAKESGATVVGVTSYARSTLAELSDHPLVAGAKHHAWDDEVPVGNIVQMLILTALHSLVTGGEFKAKSLIDAVVTETLTKVVDEG